MGKKEALHVLTCPDCVRARLIQEQADKLEKWLRRQNTHADIGYWVPKYVMLCNTRWMMLYTHMMGADFLQVAKDLDKLG